MHLRLLLFFASLTAVLPAQAQTSDSTNVCRAALDYIEGFYEGDTAKLQRSLNPALYKYGYWQSKTGVFEGEKMTYAEAIAFAKKVAEKKHFAKPDAPKRVELLDLQSNIACVKVTAWWGLDYLLLGKQGDNWMIDQVLWQGPIKTIKP